MLPAARRLRRRSDFDTVTRGGARVGGRLLVVHALSPADDADRPVRVGFVVSRAVGPAVVRNRVRRRLRHLMKDRLDAFAPGSRIVVRANPSAAGASSSELAGALDTVVTRAASRA